MEGGRSFQGLLGGKWGLSSLEVVGISDGVAFSFQGYASSQRLWERGGGGGWQKGRGRGRSGDDTSVLGKLDTQQ